MDEILENIGPKDFELVGEVAAHCDLKKLRVAVREAIDFDLEPVLCGFWPQVASNWNNESLEWKDLIYGSRYEGCGGVNRSHKGLKDALIYYAYSRYIIINSFNDTPGGPVTKTNEFSVPKPLKELQQFSEKYRNMGRSVLKGVENYLCLNYVYYPGFDRSICRACGCAGECGGKTTNKGFGVKGKNINKWRV